MAKFSYVAIAADGQKVQATQDAADGRAVAASLRDGGLVPVSIEEVSGSKLFGAGRIKKQRGRIRRIDVATFTRQLSVMLNAGIGLAVSLDDIASQVEKQSLASVLGEVRMKVMGGLPLSAALKEHPRVFKPLYCAIARAGEESGNLEGTLKDLAGYLEGQTSLRRKIVAALVYPAFVLGFLAIAIAIIFLWLVPQFSIIFESLGKKLPPITQVAIAISSILRGWFFPLLLVPILLVIGYFAAARSERGRRIMDRMKIKFPLFGPLVLKTVLVRFLTTLSTLQRSGVAILMSLDIASETAGNVVVEDQLRRAREEVMRGSFLSKELARSKVFPPLMVRMLAVGEETGRIDELLDQTAAFYREELDASIQAITSLMTPVLIISLGVVVGFVVMALWFPIFSLAT